MIGHSDATVNTENAGKTKKNPRHRIYWKDVQATKGVHLEFDGIPFLILGHKLLECQNGPDRNRAKVNLVESTDILLFSTTSSTIWFTVLKI